MVALLQKRWVLDSVIIFTLLGLFGLAIMGSTAAYAGDFFLADRQPWWDGFLQNSGTEMLGAVITFVFLELIRGRREQKAQEETEKQRAEDLKALQRSVGEQLREQMRDLFQRQNIAFLSVAKTPEERKPILASMKATKLLRGAILRETDLQGANLSDADLQRANLYKVNLQAASLRKANLQGVWWLTVEQLRQAESLKGATLPDGTTLPFNDTWREAFETWCETAETETGSLGTFIKPVDPNAEE